nr:hypothetical protein [Tanacetum cinerariifolium]
MRFIVLFRNPYVYVWRVATSLVKTRVEAFAYLMMCVVAGEMKKIIMVVFVVLQAAVEGAHFNAGGAHFNARREHPKGCVRLKNACNLASCNKSCEDAGGGICISKDAETISKYFCYSKMEMKKIIMVVLVVLQAAAEGAHFNAGGAHFNAGGAHQKGYVRLKNACNLASCNRSCEDAGGSICIPKDLFCYWA